jgi:ABC-type lipoprotein export system ATPase subunit
MELMELRNIYKTYHLGELDVPVLKGVSLSIKKGELVALMGASGSGKSTLMNILGCLDHPTSGQFFLDGQEVSNMSSDERAPLSYTAEHLSDRESRQRAMELINRVGLGDRYHHEPSQLSGGQQQRVAIARALINQPALLLADEPTGNLDSHTSEDVLKMFQQLNQEEGITIILVTHDPNVARYARRIIGISDGVIVDGATLQGVRQSGDFAGATGGPAAVL